MSEKRRGLGRGLGALIPSAAEGRRPVDVFFPNGSTVGSAQSDAPTSVAVLTADVASDTDVEKNDATTTAAADDTPGLGGDRPTEVLTDDEHRLENASPQAPVKALDRPFLIDSVSRETYEAATGTAPSTELLPVPGASFAELDVTSIRPNARQPRTTFDENDLAELVGSIREIGVLQPIIVRPARDSDGYELIMGERRWRASQEAGLTTIPAIIRETEDSDLLRDALLENLHRSDLNPLEEAAAYRQLLDDFGCTHEELATRISRSRPQISNTLRLLRLPPLVQRRVAAGVLSAGHARALLGLSDGAEIERLAQRIVAEGISVRATEEIVALGGLDKEKKPVARPRAGGRIQAIDDLASRLSDRFETRVKVDLGKTKGKLTVEFASVEDLNRILSVMAPEDSGLFKK